MAARSTKMYYERVPSAALVSAEPVSAFRAWTVRDNLQHLADVSGQYRINWVADMREATGLPLSTVEYRGAGLYSHPQPLYWAQEFPIMRHRPDVGPSLDIRIGTKLFGSATKGIVTAQLVYGNSAPGSANPLWSTVASTTVATATWLIDGQFTFNELEHVQATRLLTVRESDGTRRRVRMPTLRLEAILDGSFSAPNVEGSVHLVGVSVREYV